MLKAVFAANPRVYIYDEAEANPYMGMLALAGTMVVSNDSVNMMSGGGRDGQEAGLYSLAAGTQRHQAGRASLKGSSKTASARPLAGKLESWNYETKK